VNRLLHERNIYVFLASVAEEAMANDFVQLHQILGFLLVKKLVQKILFLNDLFNNKTNYFKLRNWEEFIESKDFKAI
jgi:serine/threonine-protein kinase ULK/ATG1